MTSKISSAHTLPHPFLLSVRMKDFKKNMVHSWIITLFCVKPFPSWHGTACSLTSVLLKYWQGTQSYLVLVHGHFERVIGVMLALCACSTQEGPYLCGGESAWGTGATQCCWCQTQRHLFTENAAICCRHCLHLAEVHWYLFMTCFFFLYKCWNTFVLCLCSTAALHWKVAGVALPVEKVLQTAL